MDEQQLLREYREFCSYSVNPMSFETWRKYREKQYRETLETVKWTHSE